MVTRRTFIEISGLTTIVAIPRSANRVRHFIVYGDSADSFVSCCHLADQFVFYYFLYLSVYLSYGELNCDGLHILITFIYIITPLLTSTHKPVLARYASSWLLLRVAPKSNKAFDAAIEVTSPSTNHLKRQRPRKFSTFI